MGKKFKKTAINDNTNKPKICCLLYTRKEIFRRSVKKTPNGVNNIVIKKRIKKTSNI